MATIITQRFELLPNNTPVEAYHILKLMSGLLSQGPHLNRVLTLLIVTHAIITN